MTISFLDIGTPVADNFIVEPSVPNMNTQGKLGVCWIVAKPNTTGMTTPSGWTQKFGIGGGTGSQGVDTGQMRLGLFTKLLTADDANSTLTIALSTGDNGVGIVLVYEFTMDTPNFGAGTTGGSTTHDTSWSATGGVNQSVRLGDMLIGASGMTSEASSQSSRSVSATSSTFGTIQSRFSGGSGIGNHAWLDVWDVQVLSGTSTAAPVYTHTDTANESGITGFCRMREFSRTPIMANAPAVVSSFNW